MPPLKTARVLVDASVVETGTYTLSVRVVVDVDNELCPILPADEATAEATLTAGLFRVYLPLILRTGP